MSLSLIAYGFNEEENIYTFVKLAYKFCIKVTKDFEIIYLDDGSSDDTLKIIKRLKKINKYKIRIFRNKKNEGIGYSFKKILKLPKKDIIIHQTIDWSYDIHKFIPHLNLIKNNKFDVIHGYRKFNVKTRSDNIARGLISIINKILIGLLYGNFTRDFQNVYVIKKKCLKGLDIKSRSSFANPELLLYLLMQNFRIAEVNINFKKRKLGTAKGAKLKFLAQSVYDILTLWPSKGLNFKINNKNQIKFID